ncbi:MAG: bifunctional enoyl-CoA hydratase/phosphate acetyltransferase [Pseudomonadota bacterium]
MLSDKPVEIPAGLLTRAQRCTPLQAVVANAGSRVVLESAKLAMDYGLLVPTLVGEASVIDREAHALGWDLSAVRTVPAADEHEAARTAVALVRDGEGDALVKGDVHTDVLLRAVLDKSRGIRTESLLSHVFHMTVPGSDQSLCITDAVLNVLPTLAQKQAILENAITLLHALGNPDPKIALLSAAETVSTAMPSSVEAAALRDWAQTHRLNATVDGPLAFDLAVSPEAATIKGLQSAVAGRSDALLVPNIETGNALFKMMVYFQAASAAGIVLGARVPIMLTSRADPPAARVASAALALVSAHHAKA